MLLDRSRAFAALCLTSLLTGCTLATSAPSTPLIGAAIHGSVHGGQQPVVGAAVYLYAAGAGGYGGNGLAPSAANASVSLLTSSVLTNDPAHSGLDTNGNYFVLTDATGSFSITGDYACTPNTQVYLYAVGGNTGAGAGVNTAAAFLAALGNCPSTGSFAASLPLIQVNEVTTVAVAYALSGFATDAIHISNSGTPLAQTGIANAFANAANLASLTTGSALTVTPAGNGVVPQAEIDTLANILAACVNSTGPSSTGCSTLFSNALSGGATGTVPTDTATAAINIAHNPAANVAALYGNPTPAAPFSPSLSTQPSDFTLALTFTGSRTGSGNDGINGVPQAVAIDAYGNVFSSIYGESAADISKLSPLGADLTTPTTFVGNSTDNPTILAIDPSNNLWAANTTNHSANISEFSNSGMLLSGSGYTGGSVTSTNTIYSLAFDPTGNLAVAAGNTITLFNSSGQLVAPTPAYPTSISPFAIAYDPGGDLWYVNSGSGTTDELYELLPTGAAAANTPFTTANVQGGAAIALDHSSDAFVAGSEYNTDIGYLSVNNNSGATLFPSGIADPANGQPNTLAIDGSGSAFLCTYTDPPSQITRITFSGATVTSSATFGAGTLNSVTSNLAIDGSGNVWVSDYPESYPTPPSRIVEFVGLAAPVVTPLSAGVANNMVGSRP